MAKHAFHLLDPRGARQRLLFALLVGVIAWIVTPASLSLATRALITWNAGGAALLVIAASIIMRADTEETRRRAAAEDPGRTFVWLFVLGASAFSLFAATMVSREAKELPHFEGNLLVAMSIAAVAISWVLTHTGFTLRYAHLYYREGPDNEGGIELPGDDKPDDLDFAYFAFTIGMCFQVSDATITSRTVRRTALAHAVMSFAYNTGILALLINVVINQLG
jgi:uncharacterized membrane protein